MVKQQQLIDDCGEVISSTNNKNASDCSTRAKHRSLVKLPRTRLHIMSSVSSHPYYDNETVRLVLWSAKESNDVRLISSIKAFLLCHKSPFFGNIVIGERYMTRTTVILIGSGAHDTALYLLQNGRDSKHWSNFKEHRSEWHCPQLPCIVASGKSFNITDVCKECGRNKPFNLTSSSLIWMEDLKKSLNDNNTLTLKGNSGNISSDGNVRQMWERESNINVNHYLRPLTLKLNNGARLWAFDYRDGSGAKCWMLSHNLNSFLDVYCRFPPKNRNTYEVIPPNQHCRMVYDLDMHVGSGLNVDKNHQQMLKDISECHCVSLSFTEFICKLFLLMYQIYTVQMTHLVMDKWSSGELKFREEVLVAHGPAKISYHLIIKAYNANNTEVLLNNFMTCKAIAEEVNCALGETIQVECKPGKRGAELSKRITSFIDLCIYTKNRAFRLAFSCKMTSPDRPFVLNVNDHRDVWTLVLDTLVIPSHAEDSLVLDIIETEVPSTSITDGSASTGYGSKLNVITSSHSAFIPWVKELAADLPGAKKKGSAIIDFRCDTNESVLDFTLNRDYASYCHCIGRPHNEQNIMISIDLKKGKAYQRCWDQNCKDRTNGFKFKYLLSSSLPADVIQADLHPRTPCICADHCRDRQQGKHHGSIVSITSPKKKLKVQRHDEAVAVLSDSDILATTN
jgi:hypothetical protein